MNFAAIQYFVLLCSFRKTCPRWCVPNKRVCADLQSCHVIQTNNIPNTVIMPNHFNLGLNEDEVPIYLYLEGAGLFESASSASSL